MTPSDEHGLEAFPDYRWELRHLLVIYRFDAGRIAEVWVTADNLRLLDQLA
jgi:hypothetical protein